MKTHEDFELYLRKENLAEHTICSYVWTVSFYLSHYHTVNRENLLTYKGYLLESYSPQTVNVRIQAINKYLIFLQQEELLLKNVKIQGANFLENVISNEDYSFLKSKLKQDGNIKWYFIVWYLGATGARVSEIVQLKVSDVKRGYADLSAKGEKIRRLYIPTQLKNETLKWLSAENISAGLLFLNRFGQPLTTRGVGRQLKIYAEKYNLNPDVVYPHSFRHRYAKNFLLRYNDIALLADLMGHESTETTRIYLRKTANEQQELIDSIINW